MSTSSKPAAKPAKAEAAETKPQPTVATPAATPDGPIVAEVTITPKPAAAPAPGPKGKTMKVKVERSHPDFGYFAGDEAEISEENFKLYGTGSEGGEFFSKLK